MTKFHHVGDDPNAHVTLTLYFADADRSGARRLLDPAKGLTEPDACFVRVTEVAAGDGTLVVTGINDAGDSLAEARARVTAAIERVMGERAKGAGRLGVEFCADIAEATDNFVRAINDPTVRRADVELAVREHARRWSAGTELRALVACAPDGSPCVTLHRDAIPPN
jgi:hypothetical protein